jgi:hypothetical protein
MRSTKDVVLKKYVTSLLKCVDVSKYMKYITRTTIRVSQNKIDIPIISHQPGDIYEEVSTITGTCIPAAYLDNFYNIIVQLSNYVLSIYEDKQIYNKSIEIKICDSFLSCICTILHKKKITMYKNYHIQTLWIHIGSVLSSFSKYALKNIFSTEHALEIANIMNAFITYQVHQLDQIQQYTWLSESNLQLGISRVKSLGISQEKNTSELSITTLIQIPEQDLRELQEKYHVNECNLNKQYVLNGSIDCVCETTQSIYEFKCTSLLTNDHYIQAAIYKYMYDITFPLLPKKKCMVYNILTDELIEIVVEHADMKMIIESILLNNCITKKEEDDNKFIEQMNEFKKSINISVPEMAKKTYDGTLYAYLTKKE